MLESTGNPAPFPEKTRVPACGVPIVIGLPGALAMMFAWAMCGASFGLAIAGLAVAICAGLALAERVDRVRSLWTGAGVIGTMTTLPLAAALRDSPSAVLQAGCLYIAIIALCAGLTALLRACAGGAISNGLTGLMAIAWLTLPTWAHGLMTRPAFGFVADRVLPFHPLVGANAAFLGLGEWAHEPFAYRHLTNLGQDVAYAMPNSAVWSIAAHAIAAIAVSALLAINARRSFRRP